MVLSRNHCEQAAEAVSADWESRGKRVTAIASLLSNHADADHWLVVPSESADAEAAAAAAAAAAATAAAVGGGQGVLQYLHT